MNYIVEIADMLGVGLYKIFTIEGFEDTNFKLTVNGLYYYDNTTFTWEKSWLLDGILTGQRKIIKPILTEKEKEYLSAVIKPFKDKVAYIAKQQGFKYQGFMYSEKLSVEFIIIYIDDEKIILPSYEAGKMYKGMKLMEKYTVEDLGL